MDLFIWLCGCLLAVLLPSAVRADEGGEFDTCSTRSNHTVTRRCYMEIKPLLFVLFFKRTFFPIQITSMESMKHIGNVVFRLEQLLCFPRQTVMCNSCKNEHKTHLKLNFQSRSNMSLII